VTSPTDLLRLAEETAREMLREACATLQILARVQIVIGILG